MGQVRVLNTLLSFYSHLESILDMPVDTELIKRLINFHFTEIVPKDIRALVVQLREKYNDFKCEALNGSTDRATEAFMIQTPGLVAKYFKRPERLVKYEEIPSDKLILMLQIRSELIGMMPYEVEEGEKDVQKNDTTKEFKLRKGKSHKGKSKKRGGSKKISIKVEGVAKAEGEVESKDDERMRRIKQEVTKLGPGHENNFDPNTEEEWASRRLHKLPYLPWEIDKMARDSLQTILQKKAAHEQYMKDNGIVDNRTEEELANMRARVDQRAIDLAKSLEVFEKAILDLVMHPMFDNQDDIYERFSSYISFLADAHQKNNYQKISSVIDLFSSENSNFLSQLRDPFFNCRRADTDYFSRIKTQFSEIEIDIPSVDDAEEYCKTMRVLLSEDTLESQIRLYKMAVGLSTEHSPFKILKQKSTEHCLRYILKIIKQGTVCFNLYIAELILKLTMDSPIVRKYCWRDPDFFPMLSNLLVTKDPDPEVDPRQILGDAIHIIYVSMTAVPRDVFVQISKAMIFERFIDILKEPPQNYRDGQIGEDIIINITLMTDHWDVFERQMREIDVMHWVKNWRKHALKYSSVFKRFVWNIEFLLMRLKLLYHSDDLKRKRPNYRLEEFHIVASARRALKENNRIICSNPKCYKLSEIDQSDRYKKCSKCSLSYYCCKECQLNHWVDHKEWCRRPTYCKKSENRKVGKDTFNFNEMASIKAEEIRVTIERDVARESLSQFRIMQDTTLDTEDVEYLLTN